MTVQKRLLFVELYKIVVRCDGMGRYICMVSGNYGQGGWGGMVDIYLMHQV